jgi:hypothetical protein
MKSKAWRWGGASREAPPRRRKGVQDQRTTVGPARKNRSADANVIKMKIVKKPLLDFIIFTINSLVIHYCCYMPCFDELHCKGRLAFRSRGKKH